MDYHRLKAWELADKLALLVYAKTKDFPQSELFALTSQMRRAAVSVPGNIAEGSARKHRKEFLQFLYVALSSLTELRYYIELSKNLGYLRDGSWKELKDVAQETTKVLQGLISRLERVSKTDL